MMMDTYFSNINKDILESKGVYTFYLLLLILSCVVVGMTESPILALLPRLLLAIIGLAHLLPTYVFFKSERTKKQNQKICLYIILLIALIVSTVIHMI